MKILKNAGGIVSCFEDAEAAYHLASPGWSEATESDYEAYEAARLGTKPVSIAPVQPSEPSVEEPIAVEEAEETPTAKPVKKPRK